MVCTKPTTCGPQLKILIKLSHNCCHIPGASSHSSQFRSVWGIQYARNAFNAPNVLWEFYQIAFSAKSTSLGKLSMSQPQSNFNLKITNPYITSARLDTIIGITTTIPAPLTHQGWSYRFGLWGSQGGGVEAKVQ